MKKSVLFIAAAAVLALPSVSAAQTSTTQTGSVNASAYIPPALSFGTPTSLVFATSGASGIVPGQEAVGTGSIPLTHNSDVTISFPNGTGTGLLTGPGGATVQPTYACAYTPATGTATSLGACTSTTGTLISQTAGTSTTGTIGISGTIAGTATGALAPGTYSGTINIKAVSPF